MGSSVYSPLCNCPGKNRENETDFFWGGDQVFVPGIVVVWGFRVGGFARMGFGEGKEGGWSCYSLF